jgi:cellulose synthase/poly-beta-1,6-N-acetylglucosamine synthase-like glycosyltransferase
VSADLADGLRLAAVVVLLALVGLGMIPVLSTAAQMVLIAVHGFRNHYRAAAPYFPRVAIVIPAWNEGGVIGASIDRLMSLDYPRDRLRVFVVDDASTDGTPAAVRAKADEYPGAVVHLRREVGGQGKAQALNHGIRAALDDDWTQAVLIMDADVIFLRDSLRRMSRHLADPEVGAVTAYIREGSAETTYLTRCIAFEYVLGQLAARRAQNVTASLACLAGGAQLHSRANIEALGGGIDTTTLAEDTVTTFETQLRGRRAIFEPLAVVLAGEPGTVQALWRQRLRWARGNVQVTRRYSWLWLRRGRDRRLGSIGFAAQWFSVVALPLVMVIAPLGFVGLFLLDDSIAYTAFRVLWIGAACLYVYVLVLVLQLDPAVGRRSWREAIMMPGLLPLAVMVTAFFPGLLENRLPGLFGLHLTDAGRVAWTLAIYLWISLSMVVGWVAKVVEHTRVGRYVTPVLVCLAGYGPLMCAIAVDAFVREARGAERSWEKTEQRGRVVVGAAEEGGTRSVGRHVGGPPASEGAEAAALGVRTSQGEHVATAEELQLGEEAQLVAELEADRRGERRLIWQSAVALGAVAALVVVGRVVVR